MDVNEVAFSIIAEAGDAKSSAMEAIAHAQEGAFDAADEAMARCAETLSSAHEIQTGLITAEMRGEEPCAVNILMVHAQDHLMGAGLMRELAQIIIAQYHVIAKLEGKG